MKQADVYICLESCWKKNWFIFNALKTQTREGERHTSGLRWPYITWHVLYTCSECCSAEASSSSKDSKPCHEVDLGVKPDASSKMSYSHALSSPTLHAKGYLPSEIFLTFHQRQWRQTCKRCIRGKKKSKLWKRIFRRGCWHGMIKKKKNASLGTTCSSVWGAKMSTS